MSDGHVKIEWEDKLESIPCLRETSTYYATRKKKKMKWCGFSIEDCGAWLRRSTVSFPLVYSVSKI